MTDLEMVKKCAEEMGHDVSVDIHGRVFFRTDGTKQPDRMDYDPLTNDAQAMALVKALKLDIEYGALDVEWSVISWETDSRPARSTSNKDLNRAIVECVARMK